MTTNPRSVTLDEGFALMRLIDEAFVGSAPRKEVSRRRLKDTVLKMHQRWIEDQRAEAGEIPAPKSARDHINSSGRSGGLPGVWER